MKKILNYLIHRFIYEIKTVKFYLIILFHSVLVGIIILISRSKYDFSNQQQLIDALIIAFAISFFVNLVIVVGKNSFLKNVGKHKERQAKLKNLSPNDAKIRNIMLEQKQEVHRHNSLYSFLFVAFSTTLSILICYLNYPN
ncbi:MULTISPECIES: hypothetical protein [unclassified Mycoplasma]|uniref:hypothetical protein n=1 Tax=unclassified Mycoplasma TaxID=2683645 RepID=UPI00211C355B|nr:MULTISPECIES: hypothetical protein [unclassified Mycoplasma]UUM19566.1 hypothetical protein NPA11_02200 [Mycoplasma sp. 1578d]UUM24485.1 hypothetical protein NPA12_02175 [Mycoplasma sp. 3686d]